MMLIMRMVHGLTSRWRQCTQTVPCAVGSCWLSESPAKGREGGDSQVRLFFGKFEAHSGVVREETAWGAAAVLSVHERLDLTHVPVENEVLDEGRVAIKTDH